MTKMLRLWATPLIVGSMLLMMVSGIFMFFHIDLGYLKPVHEWAGWVLLVATIAHLILNWRAFTTYFKRPVAKAIMGVGALTLAVALIIPVPETSNNGPNAVFGVLADAPLDRLAEVADKSFEQLQQDLAKAGYSEVQPSDTPADLAGDKGGVRLALLNTVLN